jgi:hypothetical protein
MDVAEGRDGPESKVEYGDYTVAKRAGFREDDGLFAFDGQDRRWSESLLLAYALQRKRLVRRSPSLSTAMVRG